MTTTYISVVKYTAHRVWRRRSFWIIQGLLATLTVLISILMFLSNPNIPITAGAAAPGLFTLALYYLVLPILVAPVILDDFDEIGELLWSGPLESLVHFAGVFSGLWLALLPGSVVLLGSWFLADLLWVNLMPEWSWLVSLAVYLLANTLGLSLIFLLTMVVRRTFSLLLSWAALWVWVYISIVFSAAIREGFTPLSATAYTNIFFHNLVLSPSLGLGLAQDQVLGMFAWFLGLSLAALCLALLLSPKVDPRRSMRRGWLIPLVVCISLLTAAAGYALISRAITAHAIPPSPRSVQMDVWDVLTQRAQVEVDASSGAISGSTFLQLSADPALDQPEIVLRLNAGLSLTAATGENGQDLPARRVGDSVVISLEAIPPSPVGLNLAWQGKLQTPYTAYEQKWRHSDAPHPYRFTYMPHTLKAFVHPTGGYILRDGDWKPWPWSSKPHQARENYLAIRPSGGEAVASVPMQNGLAIWEGPLPKGLLVFLPGKQIEAGDAIIAASPLTGKQHLEQANLFAVAATRLSSIFKTPPTRYVVVAPYLNELVWSGNLLLVPDGGGYTLSKPLTWLYTRDVTGNQQPILARATLAALARAYLHDHIPLAPLEIQPRLSLPVEEPRVVEIASISEQDWQEENGHWIQAPELFDVDTTWEPRRRLTLSPQGEWTAVAFWMAMELTDNITRQADLDLIAYFSGEGKPERNFNQNQYMMAAKLVWPDVLEPEKGRVIVWQLHRWAETLGPQEALSMVADVIQETRPGTVEELIAELEGRSGTQIVEEQP